MALVQMEAQQQAIEALVVSNYKALKYGHTYRLITTTSVHSVANPPVKYGKVRETRKS